MFDNASYGSHRKVFRGTEMKCCINCFKDKEVIAWIETNGRIGNCNICGTDNTYIYDFDENDEDTYFQELMESILEIYVPQSKLPSVYPIEDVQGIEIKLLNDWNIFNLDEIQLKMLLEIIIDKSNYLENCILYEKVGIPRLYDEDYVSQNGILGMHSWDEFKHYITNINRFHNDYVNTTVIANILKETESTIYKSEKFFRARISNKMGKKGFARKDMGAPPYGVASAGRTNSKGQSCLYLSNCKKTTVKEIRAQAFDYVTIATFRLKEDIKVLDLSSITHTSPFYTYTDKTTFLLNEKILRAMEQDLSKPKSVWESELDYIPTQYISDFAKFLGYQGVKYKSTFDKQSYNIAVFYPELCECIYHRNFRIGELDYKMSAV